jgi:hypothetical protein
VVGSSSIARIFGMALSPAQSPVARLVATRRAPRQAGGPFAGVRNTAIFRCTRQTRGDTFAAG